MTEGRCVGPLRSNREMAEEGQLRRPTEIAATYDLFHQEPAIFPVDGTKTIEQAFDRFHEANPHIYEAIVELALQAKGRGFDCWSINGIFEVLRWNVSMHTDEEAPRLSNNYRSRYARLVMRRHPELDGFSTTRELTAQ